MTSYEGDELLVKFLALTVIECRTVDRILLILPHILQWTFVIGALTHMDQLRIRRFWNLLNMCRGDVHHGRIVETRGREKRSAVVSRPTDGGIGLVLLGLHSPFYFGR